MAEYKGIKGFKVQYLDQDPVPTVAGWSSGANMPVAVDQGGGVGTQTTALQFGGLPNPKQQTLSYDGTAWTALNPTGQDRSQFACFGTPSAAVAATGEIVGTGTNNSENWNGTSWTSGGNVSTPRNQAAGFGTQTAGVITGGFTGTGSSATEHYDGTTWTGGGSLPSIRYGGAAGGTLTAGIHAVGQLPGSTTNEVLYYNGSTWSAQAGTANVARAGMQSTGAGTQTAFGIYGGSNTPLPGSTEFWDGISFTAASDLSTPRGSGHVGKSGTPSAGIMFGGYTTAVTAATEEYVDYSPYTGQTVENVGQVWYNGTTKALKFTDETFTGSWATGGSLSTGRYGLAGAGIQDATVVFSGGTGTAYSAATEEYNGTSWSPSGNMGTGREQLAGCGIQTAALAFGGEIAPGATGSTEEYNGATWSPSNPMNTARKVLAGAGTQTAALAFGGYTGTAGTGATEEYDGNSWANSNSLNTARFSLAGTGTQTAGLAFGGFDPGYSTATEEYTGAGPATKQSQLLNH